MKKSTSHKEFSFISIEDQRKEASQDLIGKIRRYLELGEKLFNCIQNSAPEAA